MPSTGFKVRWLTSKSRVCHYEESDDEAFCGECDRYGGGEEIELTNIIRRSIRQSVLSEKEKHEVGVGSFLRTRLEMAVQAHAALVYNNIRMNEDWFACSHSIPSEWGIEENPYEVFGTMYRISMNLEPVGRYCVEVCATSLPFTDSGLSLTHIACVKIASSIAHEYLHTTHCAYRESFCMVLCDRRTEWSSMALWKLEHLDLPETLNEQLIDTMEWLEWSRVLEG